MTIPSYSVTANLIHYFTRQYFILTLNLLKPLTQLNKTSYNTYM
jgi:hypothetical protein